MNPLLLAASMAIIMPIQSSETKERKASVIGVYLNTVVPVLGP